MAEILQPMDDRIIVRRDAPKEKSKGGIFIPDMGKDKMHQGVVLAVGEGKLLDNGTRVPIPCHEGERVIFKQWQGCEVENNNEKVVIVHQDDLLAVIR